MKIKPDIKLNPKDPAASYFGFKASLTFEAFTDFLARIFRRKPKPPPEPMPEPNQPDADALAGYDAAIRELSEALAQANDAFARLDAFRERFEVTAPAAPGGAPPRAAAPPSEGAPAGSEEFEAAFDLIRHFENDSLRRAPDTFVDEARVDAIGRGNPTEIGYGFTANGLSDVRRMGFPSLPSVPPKMVKSYADAFLRDQLLPAYVLMVRGAVGAMWDMLEERQRLALASFAFNVGEANLRVLVGAKGTGKSGRLCQGNIGSVESILPQYRMSSGKVYDGLVRRRAAELALWRRGTFEPYPPEYKTA